MLSPENKLFCRLDHMPGSEQEQQRLKTLSDLGLLEAESVPIFEEATQMAAHFLDAPICILGLIERNRQWLKSAVGLSRIGLMNDLATSRQLPRHESFCAYVVDSHQALIISDTMSHTIFADSLLVQRYGIRAYLGVPLLASNGHCLGTLAIMGLQPRDFNAKEVEFLEVVARWSMSEFERNYLLKNQHRERSPSSLPESAALHSPAPSLQQSATGSVKTNLISQMVQELRTPLTSILGMTSVLTREIYGPLTEKQKEYMGIIRHSGHYLLSLINEILELGMLDDSTACLNLSLVDIEMLCQQAILTLGEAAKRREQQMRLTVEPGHRIWLLDKDKVRQMLYHLVFSMIQSSSPESIIRVHVSRKQSYLNITVWISHPWLGDGLPSTDLCSNPLLAPFLSTSTNGTGDHRQQLDTMASEYGVGKLTTSSSSIAAVPPNKAAQSEPANSRQGLGLMLSRQLAEIHGGYITMQGSSESGYRYVISLPQMSEAKEEI
jgi:signal transduction histidine kinase